jgi:meso-butanediol dehydrogenase / (S,S)-butanediol dehydrogenase / diacetyl reductase
MTSRFAGRVVLITGTGGGQGRAAALAFAREGATVVGCDVQARNNEQTVELVRAAGGRMLGNAPVDLSDPEQARAWVDGTIAAHGRLDVVYNNGSAARIGLIQDTSIEDWRFTIANELDLVFFVTKFAWPQLIRQGGGVVINTASVSGHIGTRAAPMVAHAAAKGGVIAMSRQMAVEGSTHGIRVVSISPGPVETPGTAALFADPATRQAMIGQNLVPRPGRPEDIAGMALYLASDEASWVTGQDFIVDGGVTAT